jgi:hypothetical protein
MRGGTFAYEEVEDELLVAAGLGYGVGEEGLEVGEDDGLRVAREFEAQDDRRSRLQVLHTRS